MRINTFIARARNGHVRRVAGGVQPRTADSIAATSIFLIGNARAGFMADAWGVSASIWIGGLACLVGVIATGFVLPRFWAYRSPLGDRPN